MATGTGPSRSRPIPEDDERDERREVVEAVARDAEMEQEVDPSAGAMLRHTISGEEPAVRVPAEPGDASGNEETARARESTAGPSRA